MIPRTPTTPESVTDEWLEACGRALAASEFAAMAAYPDLCQLFASGAWLKQQLVGGGMHEALAAVICRSHGEVFAAHRVDPWQIAEASLEAARATPPPSVAPGDPLPTLVVFALIPRKNTNESEGF